MIQIIRHDCGTRDGRSVGGWQGQIIYWVGNAFVITEYANTGNQFTLETRILTPIDIFLRRAHITRTELSFNYRIQSREELDPIIEELITEEAKLVVMVVDGR